MKKCKFLVEMSGTPPTSEIWKRFGLPPSQERTECPNFVGAAYCVKKAADMCRDAIQKTFIEGGAGFGERDIKETKLYASASIQVGSLYIRWKIVKVLDDGTRQTPALYKPDPYVNNRYGLPDIKGWSAENMQVPGCGLLFAQKYKNGNMVSLLVVDKNRKFGASLANQLLLDTNVTIGEGEGFVGNQEVTNYYLPFKNYDCVLFQPTIHQAISDCSNVATEYDVEVVFSFDEFLLPMVITTKTDGTTGAPIHVADVFKNVADAVGGSFEDVDDFFKGCGNRTELPEGKVGFVLHAFSLDGRDADISITPEYLRCEDLVRAITSIRIVRLCESIIQPEPQPICD